MEILLKTPEKLIFRTNLNYSVLNAIRRSVEEIQTLAIDEVEIFRNDSALYDETLAHRLGLVPLRTEAKMGDKTSVDFSLKKTGPGKVYSGDLQGNAKVMFDKIPLTLLEDKQIVEVVATARLGTGIDHAKHVPGLVYYRNLVEVKAGNAKVEDIVQNSRGLIKPEKKGSFWICDLNEAEIDDITNVGKDAVRDLDEFVFVVESFGHMDAEKILASAIDKLGENLESFEKSLK